MANAKKADKSAVNMSLLAGIATGAITRVSPSDGLPLLECSPPLIEVNKADVVDGMAAVRLTDAGKSALPNGSAVKHETARSETPIYAIITNAVLPPKPARSGRSGGGAPTIYPWATMEVGHAFFVPVSADKPDPVKSMTSAVSSANMKYSEPTGEKRQVTRAKRGDGNKAVVGPDGQKIMETKTVDVMKPTRKFELSAVTKGNTYGGFTAEQDGALVQRVL
jgi:hypothetical protein